MRREQPTSELLLESIRIHDGTPELLTYHQQRMNRTRKAYYPKSPVIKLAALIKRLELPETGTHKLRLEYDSKVRRQEIIPYASRPVNSIRIIDADDVRYGKKYADRTTIKKYFERRGEHDDILMIQRGHVTDTSYANVALYDGTHWYTPAWPLLRGTRREMLVENGTLRPSVIRERDLVNFEKLRMVNALLPWGDGPELSMDHVKR